jgi:phosphate/sulfate permease
MHDPISIKEIVLTIICAPIVAGLFCAFVWLLFAVTP